MDNKKQQTEFIDVRGTLLLWWSKWYWFAISAFVCLSLAFIYATVKKPVYLVKSNILIAQDDSNIMSGMGGFGQLFGTSGYVDDEVFVVSSHTVLRDVVKDLKLNKSCVVKEGLLKSSEYFKKYPVDIVTDTDIADTLSVSLKFNLKVDEAGVASVEVKDSQKDVVADLENQKFPIVVETKYGVFTIKKTADYKEGESFKAKLYFSGYDDVAESLKEDLDIYIASKKSNVIQIEMETTDVDKAKLILNDIVKYYNVRGVEQRSEQSRLTLDFLDSRIQLIAQDLTDSEADVEGYKKNQGIVDVATEATYQTTKKGKFEGELVQAEIDLNIMQMTKEFLADSKNKYELIPTTVSDETVKAGITNYNELVLSRMNLVRTAKEGNIALSKMNDRIDALRANINTSLDRAIAQQNKVISDMRLQLGVTDSRLGNIPTQERQYRDIKRKQTIKEQLYLFLMQRREDTALMIANTTPKGVIVDKAFSLSEPITMKKRMILLLAFVFSLILPPVILVIKKVLRNKFDTKDELKKLTVIPVIGEICKDNTGDNIVVKQGSVSTVAELFRAVRSNLQQFFLSGEDDKVVLMTSTVSGEGKSFVSVNLAQTLAITNNDLKVLLVGMDIRKPRIAEYLSIPSLKGLTDYVARTGMNLDDVIQKNPNGLAFDVITSGPIPPNPAELLLSQRVDDMFAELRKRYDYIVVDTAPVGLVSDTLTLSRIGDATIYVCRANYTTKTDIQYANSIYEEGRLKKMSILLNDTIVRKGYGYGYGENRESQK